MRRLLSDQVSLILRRTSIPTGRYPSTVWTRWGALELRTRIETETGIRINPSDLATIGTIRGSGGVLLC